MPTFVNPSTDLEREAFLLRVLETGRGDIAAGRVYLEEGTLNEVDSFLSDFRPAVRAATETASARSKESREAGEAVEKVGLYCRDMWEVLKRRARREGQPAEILTFYGLPLSGEVPKPSGREAWVTLADQLVAGDHKAVDAGYPPMANPSAAELDLAITDARSEQSDIAGADRAHDEAQDTLAKLRDRSAELVTEVMTQLRFYLRKMDASSARRVMRTYGARFDYIEGEPVDAEDPADAGTKPVTI